jgi:hypothetical protein
MVNQLANNSIFVSHSTADREFVKKELVEFLHQYQLKTWFYEASTPIGANIESTLLNGLEQSKWFMIIISKNSIKSEWVRKELDWALVHREKKIIPIRIDDSKFSFEFPELINRNYVDYRWKLAEARTLLLRIFDIEYKQAGSFNEPFSADLAGPGSFMAILVDNYGDCKVKNSKITLCNYHRNRLETRFYKSKYQEVVDQSKTAILSPDPKLLELLTLMESKTGVAGSWSLMATQRKWFCNQLREIFDGVGSGSKWKLLQCGIAGPVHYFGNIQLISSSIEDTSAGESKVSIVTIDKCSSPIIACENILKLIQSNPKSRKIPDQCPVANYPIILEGGFKKLLERLKNSCISIEQTFVTEDILGEGLLTTEEGTFDIVFSHFLFSMWREDESRKIHHFAEKIHRLLRNKGSLLLSISNSKDPRRIHFEECDEIIKEKGFSLRNVTNTWDVFDLSSKDIGLLNEGHIIEVEKECKLVQYIKN